MGIDRLFFAFKNNKGLFKTHFIWQRSVCRVFFYIDHKNLERMIDVIDTKEIVATTGEEQENVLGHLYWFNIGKLMIESDDLKQYLINSGLGDEWMPNKIRSVDAFRRATKEVQAKKPTANPKVFKNYLMREVHADKDFVQRNIVVETVDQDNKKLGYEAEVAIVKLDKKSNTLVIDSADKEAMSLIRQAEEKFYLYRDHYSAQHVRVMVAKILDSLAPIAMRENGVIYFVPNKMTQGLTNLVTFVNSLDNSDAFKVPVINSREHRDMIEKKLRDYLDRLLEQCKNTEDLREDQIQALVEETNIAIRDYKHYKKMVESESETFEDKIFELRSSVVKILNE
jgi:hypothetical protein